MVWLRAEFDSLQNGIIKTSWRCPGGHPMIIVPFRICSGSSQFLVRANYLDRALVREGATQQTDRKWIHMQWIWMRSGAAKTARHVP
jgi:hypothetical protein